MKFFITFLLISGSFLLQAQDQKKQPSNTMIMAFNGEQMLEKMGFENLMSLIFDQSRKRNTEKNKIVRKSLAAIYGSGIDFKRKTWISFKERVSNERYREYSDNNAMPVIHIPVANKAVFIENIQNIIAVNDRDYDDGNREVKEGKTIINGTITTITTRESIFVFTDKDLVITELPGFYSGYDYYKGKTIRIDTVIVERDFNKKFVYPPVINDAEIIEKKEHLKEKNPVLVIDAIDKNGLIKRIYKPKTPNKNDKVKKYEEEVNRASARHDFELAPPPAPAVMDTAAYTVPATEEIIALKDVIGKAKEMNGIYNKKIDTIKRTEYVNDTMELQIWYVEYTQKEIDSIIKVKDAERIQKREKYVTDFVSNVASLQPYSNPNADMTKIIEAKEDIAMYVHADFGNSFGMNNPFMKLRTFSGTMDNNMDMAYLGFVNFENGKATLKAQSSCCTGLSNTVNEMYYPITNFWPAALNTNNLAKMRYHINVPELMKYYQKMFPAEMELEKKLAEEGFSFKEIGEVFEGEIALSLGMTKPADTYDRREPKIIVALKLKDAAKAVDMMNKIANKEIDLISNYRFDEKGEYLLISSEKNELEQLLKPKPGAVLEKTNINVGSFGEVYVNIKGLIEAGTRNYKKQESFFPLTRNFFDELEAVNYKTEDGSFIGEMSMGMGDKKTNALNNLIQLFKNINEAEKKQIEEEEIKRIEENKKQMEKMKGELKKNNTRTKTNRPVTKKKN